MKITVINGVKNKGCTYKMKDAFLEALHNGHEITEYHLPTDAPEFCTGCKACFFRDISVCPHSKYTVPIWESILAADLLVFTSPVYVFHVTGQLKALLDHYATKWMAHSPENPMFFKRAVIITNAAGAGIKRVVRDIGDSLDYWGVARRYAVKEALFGADWDKISKKRKASITRQCRRVAKKVQKPVKRPHFKVRFLFGIMGMAHKMINKSLVKSGEPQSRDYLYWKEKGWFRGGKPWKRKTQQSKRRG
ncbi:MAG: flavodoxin family protein [Firmicutes bacterium]|nr:flavodoxin family protein [Bacillota bacterium]